MTIAIQNPMSKIACIYAITNLVNWNRYIGSTNDFEIRKAGHIYSLN